MSSSRAVASASRAVRAATRRPEARLYSAAAAEAAAPSPSTPPPVARRTRTTTPDEAQAFLSDILKLPPSAAFPPALALQILTHKSYRFAHRIAHAPPYTPSELEAGQASHNERLGFVGKRALGAYTTMFLHEALHSAEGVRAAPGFIRADEQGLEQRLEDLLHLNNIGATVGAKWGLERVMRYDRGETRPDGSTSHSIHGTTVAAVLGGVFTHLGSPAAQRAYYVHVLPALAKDLGGDPALVNAAAALSQSALVLGVVPK
ncbi:hypothetical protein Q8F55_000954 [Vanrija albida]|uniref:RNase III domain-containing protein n=1 Tax=Vanrija albida TaxID=181172 RepID=A0ABR3QES6_9TREE